MVAAQQDRSIGGDGATTSIIATPLLLRAEGAAALCSTSARTWRSWDTSGKIPRAIYMGRSTYWRTDELQAWVAAGCPDRITWEAIRES